MKREKVINKKQHVGPEAKIVSLYFYKDLYDAVEKARQGTPRSKFLVNIIEQTIKPNS